MKPFEVTEADIDKMRLAAFKIWQEDAFLETGNEVAADEFSGGHRELSEAVPNGFRDILAFLIQCGLINVQAMNACHPNRFGHGEKYEVKNALFDWNGAQWTFIYDEKKRV